jgi:hypothetical protein
VDDEQILLAVEKFTAFWGYTPGMSDPTNDPTGLANFMHEVHRHAHLALLSSFSFLF